MSDWEEEFPAYRRPGEAQRVDHIKLRRDDLPLQPTKHAVRTAVGLVFSRPAETLLLGFMYVVFVNGPANLYRVLVLLNLILPEEPTGNEYENAGSIIGVISALTMGEVVVYLVTAIAVLGTFAFFLLLHAMVQASGILFWLRLVRGQEATLAHATRILPYVIPLSLTTLLMWFLVSCGYSAFVFPAFMLLVGFVFVELVVVDKSLNYDAAISAGWQIAAGYKWHLLGVLVLLWLLNLVGFWVCGVGLIVTTAIATGTIVVIYDRIAEPGNAYLRDDEERLSAFD